MIVYINDIKKQTEIDNPPLGGRGYLRFKHLSVLI